MINNTIKPSVAIVRCHEVTKFICKSFMNVSWQFNGKKLPSNVITSHNDLIPFHWLIISDIRLDNPGHYSCHGTKSGGYFDARATLTVIGK